jgi:hypothetical protein
MFKKRILAIMGAMTALPSCMSPQQVTRADEVTLNNAMKTIACGLATYSNELARIGHNSGALTDSVQVVLALKASAAGTNQLVVDARPVVGGASPFGATYTGRLENTGSRENTITIVYKNMHTVGLNKAGEVQVAKANVPIGLVPTERPWFDNPCASMSDPVPAQVVRELNKGYRTDTNINDTRRTRAAGY